MPRFATDMPRSPRQTADDVVLVEGLRTVFSKFGGALRSVPSVVLGAHVIRRILERAKLSPQSVGAVYYGVTLPAETALDGPTSGRQALLRAGLLPETQSLTIDRGCCSSLTAVHLAYKSIRDGEFDWVIAAGAENMGRAAFLSPPDLRFGHRGGPLQFKDPLFELGADIGSRPVAVDVGDTSLEWGVTREEQDAWAAASHQKYFSATSRGFFTNHVEKVSFPDHQAQLDHDELPREDTSPKVLASLKTVYGSSTITAGNAPGLDTGAAALLLTRRRIAEVKGLPILARVVGIGSVAGPPRDIAVIPGPAIQRVTESLGWNAATLDAIEINEAFAAVPIVSARYLAEKDFQKEQMILTKTNACGGAVAIGHPTGASGARLLLQLAHRLHERGGGCGVAAICGALGQGDAVGLVVN
jgi:acetyl-CoA C-acetyltransferase